MPKYLNRSGRYGKDIVVAKDMITPLHGSDESILEGDPRWDVVQRVANSPQFLRASQLRSILLFITRQAILHPENQIHEFDIAHGVLGRSSDFDPLDDNIVRVQIARLRKRLDLYFSTNSKDEQVAITVGLGNYRPAFVHRSKVASTSIPTSQANDTNKEGSATVNEETPTSPLLETSNSTLPKKTILSLWHWTSARMLLFVFLILSLISGCVALWMQNRELQRSLKSIHQSLHPQSYGPTISSFWSDFLGSGRGTDIVVGDRFFLLAQTIAHKQFTLNDYVSRNYINELTSKGKNPEVVSVLKVVADWSITNPDHLMLAQRIASLDSENKNIHLYYARNYAPDYVNQDNLILLGSKFTNPWDNLFEERMNFMWTQDKNNVNSITNKTTLAGEQKIYTETDTAGYCVLAYLPNLGNNGKVLLLEGTNSKVTEAGGDFLLSEDQLSHFLTMLHVTKLPYFEILLKTTLVKDTPLTTTIVAYRTYRK